MDQSGSSANGSAAALAGGEGAPGELFALTDEQILEIEPEVAAGAAEDAAGRPEEFATGTVSKNAGSKEFRTAQGGVGERGNSSEGNSAAPAEGNLAEAPPWLAELMKDPQRGGEAREFWRGAAQARTEVAAYREVFAGPEEARAAAERARALDEIDRGFFSGDAGERSKLAATLLREDPAAFRAMVFEGLRALEAAEKSAAGGGTDSRLTRVFGGVAGDAGGERDRAALPHSVAGNAQEAEKPANDAHGTAHRDARMAAYATFEKAANEELERGVGAAIERTLEQALPAGVRSGDGGLKTRMAAAIRADLEKVLQGDRGLGEQVGRVLAGQRLDGAAREQVVRLIGERAEQLVPGVARKVLGEWTRATLGAHRAKESVGSERQDVAAVTRSGGAEVLRESGRGDDSRQRSGTESLRGRSVDYRKLSDEQILGM